MKTDSGYLICAPRVIAYITRTHILYFTDCPKCRLVVPFYYRYDKHVRAR